MRRRGFTLMEVLIAIALIGMLAGSVFSFLWTLLARRDVLHGRSVEAQATGAFIERLEADVVSGLAGDSAAGAGVSGTTTGLKLLTRGVWLPTGELDRTAAAGDVQVSEYRFDAATGVLRGRRWAVGGAARTSNPPEFQTISEHVQRVRLRYFDGEGWSESFDSLAAGGLPVAIEVAVWLGKPAPAADTGGTPSAEEEPREPGAKSPGASDAGTTRPGAEPERAGRTVARAGLATREPDRLRVIVIPDGPVSAWKEGR